MNESPYTCGQCKKTFSRKANLNRHLLIHQNYRPFICELFIDDDNTKICNARFTRKADLITHQRVHTGEKPYSCSICDAKFSRCSDCRSHERNHEHPNYIAKKRNNIDDSADKLGVKILKCNSGIAYNIITPLPTISQNHEHLHSSHSFCDHYNPHNHSQHLHNNDRLVPHDDHYDYLVKHNDHFHLHHPFQDGCNDHGHFSAFDIEKSNNHLIFHGNHIDACSTIHEHSFSNLMNSPSLVSRSKDCNFSCLELKPFNIDHTSCFK